MTMNLRSLGLTFLVSLAAACGTQTADGPGDGASDDDRGALGKADLIGSCQGPEMDFCGEKSDGTCWCDEACVTFGDCCSDVDEVCGIDPPPGEGQGCGGFLGDTCADDEYCAYEAGQFCGAADASSTCEPRPEVCPQIFAPVCGCDGNTYSNSCMAAGAGTGVATLGECAAGPDEGQPCGGFLGNPCSDAEYCAYQPGQFCGAADASSTCEPRPEVCNEIFAPVCGCDGNTYGNSCEAAAAGTGVSTEGECPPVPPGGFCGGIAGIQCPEGQLSVDDANDDCDPDLGGADCGGVCILEPEEPAGDTCEDACGGQAESGACWCDDFCGFYDDCCDDIGDHCE